MPKLINSKKTTRDKKVYQIFHFWKDGADTHTLENYGIYTNSHVTKISSVLIKI